MIAVPVSPEMRMAVVAAPAYFSGRSPPSVPQDLVHYQCITLDLPTYGGVYAWEFDRDRREFKMQVDGQPIFNNSRSILIAALSGFGLVYLSTDTAAPYVARGELLGAYRADVRRVSFSAIIIQTAQKKTCAGAIFILIYPI